MGFGEGDVVLRLLAKVDPGRRFEAELELRRRIKEAFDREQIRLPFAPAPCSCGRRKRRSC